MKVTEAIKIFGYIFVLMLCFILMKGLSSFEYALRDDKTIKYEEAWTENFSKALKEDRLIINGENVKPQKGRLSLTLNTLDSAYTATTSFPTLIDSGYVTIKARLPEETNWVKSKFTLLDSSGIELPLDAINPEEPIKEFRSVTTAGSNLESISMSIIPNQSLDSISGYKPQELVIESLQFMRQVRPQKLF